VSKVLALAAVALACSVLGAQSVIRSDSRLVLVDSIVADKNGAYVHGLTQKDFKIWEDGKEQPITTFSFQASEASSGDREQHNLVLFFDNSTIAMDQLHLVRDAAMKFIESDAGPNRLVAIVAFGGTLRVKQNFTNDIERLRQAIITTNAGSIGNDQALGNPGDSESTIYLSRTMLGALRDLAARLAPVPGRKTVVLFSGGIRTRLDELTAAIAAYNRANAAIYTVDAGKRAETVQNVGPADVWSRGAGQPHSRPNFPQFSMGVAGGQGDAAVESAPDTLRSLAQGTGGFAISQADDLLAGMGKVGKEQNEYYMLGYVPAEEPKPGACHTIKVKVNRGDVNVRARSGYCETKNPDVLAGTATQRELESRLFVNAPPTIQASMQAPFFYISPNVARVDVALNIPGSGFKFTNDQGRFQAKLNVIGIAYLLDGAVGARFSDSVNIKLDSNKQVDEFLSTPYRYENQFEVPSGQFRLKVVFSSSAGRFGKTEMLLTVDPWKPAQFLLSGLALSNTARPVSHTGLQSAATLLGDEAPLVANGMQFTPSGTNRFHRSEKVFIYGEIYEPELTGPDVKENLALYAQMLLMNAKTGQIVKNSGMHRLQAEMQPGNPTVPMAGVLPVSDLPAGFYVAYINALDSAGRRSSRRVGFVVEP
jgi:VWFA-related protein